MSNGDRRDHLSVIRHGIAFLCVSLAFCVTPVAHAASLVNGSFEADPASVSPWQTSGALTAAPAFSLGATDGTHVANINFTTDSATGTLFQQFNLITGA